MSATKTPAENLDSIIYRLGEKFGKYQIKSYAFICIPAIFTALFSLSYVFTAKQLDYRCSVPECDPEQPYYLPVWIRNAVPFSKANTPSRCKRYMPLVDNVTEAGSMCHADIFNSSIIQRCTEFVFDTDKITILNDFNLMCEENLWKLTLVGTMNYVGQFVCMPISGIISDRYGRRFHMLGGLLISTVVGLIRSCAPTYLWFLLFEFLDMAVGSGAYTSGFVLGVELVPPSKRVLSGALISSSFAIGEAILALVAWHVQSWRSLLRYIYLPGFLIIIFFWLTPESMRWLLSKGRTEKVKGYLRKAAQMNKVELTEEELSTLDATVQIKVPEEKTVSIMMVFKSPTLLFRIFNFSFGLITCNFVYYGLSLNSVSVAGNLYLNFIAVGLIEIPAYFTTYLIVDRFGRRLSLCATLLISGVSCLVFLIISEDAVWLRLAAFLMGKFGITISFVVFYIFITELFPTPLRQSLLGLCAMFGRIGSMVAPQMPLLAQIMESLPLILFSGMSIASGLLVLLLPETLNTKLPDTIEEAETIGKKAVQIDAV